MQIPLNRKTFSSLMVAVLASFTIAACGGSNDDAATSNLAKYMPADALVYVEGAVRPEQDVADNVETLTTKLTGTSLSETIDKALAENQDGDITYKDDIDPWLGDNAAMYVSGENIVPSIKTIDDTSGNVDSSEQVGLIAETTDVDAAQAFIEKAAAEQGGATDGEYEGFSYKVAKDDDSVLGIVDDNVTFATSVKVFEAMVDASKGDSLKDTSAFADVAGKAPEGSLANLFVANNPLISAASDSTDSGETGDFAPSKVLSSLGLDLEDTGTLISLVPEADAISIVGATSADSDLESGDPSALIETFPANSVFATGSGDVGENATKIIDAIDEEGIEGVLEPGELKKQLDEFSSQGVVVGKIITSLETVGFFVSGDSVDKLGGALVATTSDPAPLKNALGMVASFIKLADDADVKPLGAGMTGLRVRTPELPGRPVVIAIKDDRLVLAIGMAAARQVLNGGGESLADSPAYKAAGDSLNGQNIDMFGNPAAIADLIAPATAGSAEADQGLDALRKFEYVVSGSGSEDNSFEFNLGLKD